MKTISLIGATGSIGRQVINVVRRHSDRYKIVALCANTPSAQLEELKNLTGAQYCAAYSADKAAALATAEYPADIIFNAAGGFSGMEYSERALRAGKTLALANKETLVCGGKFITDIAKQSGSEIIPVDSEHSAIWQCLNFRLGANDIRRLLITASGGAFRGKRWDTLDGVTPDQALNHPTWRMGEKITIDCATLANKGYEIIEAHELFSVPYEKIQAVLHPQSIVHSLVEFNDGACIAQAGIPSMEVPIQLALSYPERLSAVAPLDFENGFSLDFLPLEKANFPIFGLCVECGKKGGGAPCAFNAADEEAVFAFLSGKIPFTAIYAVTNEVLQSVDTAANGLEDIAEIDKTARNMAQRIIKRLQ